MSITMDTLEHLLLLIGTFAASSGFWMYMIKKMDQKDLTRRLLIGLAHDRIIYLCMAYIERGSITQDEHENICIFLYEPYKELGGNGAIKRLMEEINKLPVTKEITRPIRKEKENENVK